MADVRYMIHLFNTVQSRLDPLPVLSRSISQHMKKFIVLYHAPAALMAKSAMANLEEAQKGIEGWMQWAAKCGDDLLDLGSPLVGGQRLTPDGTASPSNMEVAGYSVLQAKDMKAAKELLHGHPHLAWDSACSIEVYEAKPLPGM